MRVYHDWEFLEDGRTIAPISVGMVREDGTEYYAVNRDMPHRRIAKHRWLVENVVPGLPRLHGDARLHYAGRRSNPLALDWRHPHLKRRSQLAAEVREFLLDTPDLELWGWYSAYDHVCLAWLYGPMSDLPPGVPMWTNDLRQEALRLGLSDADMPQQPSGHHNALADARHNKVMGEFLTEQARRHGG